MTKEKTSHSQRHHFVPRWYLEAWREPGTPGFWLYYRDPRGHIRLKKRPAAAIGYVDNLYSIKPDGLNFRKTISQEIEERFFAPIDAAACDVHRKIAANGVTALSHEDREVWALFVNSLIERSPRRLAEIEAQAAGIPDETIAEFKRKWPESALRPEMAAMLARIDKKAVVENGVRSAMTRYIFDSEFLKYVAAMEWLTIDLPSGQDHFLTGDSPVVINGGGQQSPIYLISMALSPGRLLVMHKKALEFNQDFTAMLAQMFSLLIVQQTQQHLVSSQELQDSQHIKYTKIVQSILKQPAQSLVPFLGKTPQ